MDKSIKQSDDSLLTPFQHDKHYIVELPVDQHHRYVITCNFAKFWIYDINKPGSDPENVQLKNLETDYYRLQFLAESGNEYIKREEVSVQAGELIGLLYDAFAKQYRDLTVNIRCIV